jgi:hypothetical protein
VIELQGHVGFLTPALEGAVSLDSGDPGQVTWDTLDTGAAPGGRAEISWPLGGSWIATLGGTYWGSWDDTSRTSGTLAVGSPISVSSVFPDVELTTEATLWHVDATLWKTCCVSPCFFTGWGLGLRGVSFDESAHYSVPQTAPGPAVARRDVEACLVAAQVSGQLQWKLTPRWDLRLRGSAFVGWLSEESEVTTRDHFGTGTQVPQTREDDSVGFGGELEVSVGFCIARGWTLRAGYGLLALFDVTRADAAADYANVLTNPGNVIDAAISDDTLLAHRIFVGVTIDF